MLTQNAYIATEDQKMKTLLTCMNTIGITLAKSCAKCLENALHIVAEDR